MNFSFVDLILTLLNEEGHLGYFENKITYLNKKEPIIVEINSNDRHEDIISRAVEELKYLYLQGKDFNEYATLLNAKRYYEPLSDSNKEKEQRERIEAIRKALFVYLERLLNDIKIKPFSLKQDENLANSITESKLFGTDGEEISFCAGHDYDINLKIKKDRRFCDVTIYQHLSACRHIIHAINKDKNEEIETTTKKAGFSFRKTKQKNATPAVEPVVKELAINVDTFTPRCWVRGTVYTDDGVYFFFNAIEDGKFKIYYYDKEFIQTLAMVKESEQFDSINNNHYIELILNKEAVDPQSIIAFLEKNGIFSDCYCEEKVDYFELMDLVNKAFHSPKELMESLQKKKQK